MIRRWQGICALALAMTLLSIVGGCRTPGRVAPSSAELGGTSWVVEQIDEQDAVERARPTVVFDAAASRVSGRASCNSYSAGVSGAGETLRIVSAVTTKMACALPVMEQEQRFLAALGAAAAYRREGDRLLLVDGNGRVARDCQRRRAHGARPRTGQGPPEHHRPRP